MPASGNVSMGRATARPALGQALAALAALAVAAAWAATRPAFDHSVYLLGGLGLLACTATGGAWPVLTGALLIATGGFAAETFEGAPLDERLLRAGVFLATGLAITVWVRRLGAERDAATRRAADQADREALLQASLEIVADALVVVDGSGRIQSFSRAAEKLFGWTAEDAVGLGFPRLMPPGETLPLDDDGIAGSTRQVTGLSRDGVAFPMELRIGEARNGGRRFLTMVVRDLRSIREAERRSEDLRAQLTQVWSLNSMGEMASVLAHELNQPLSAVTNYLRAARNLIARMELDDDDLIDAVARAGDQAVRAGEIIRTMRDLATRGGTLQRPESLSAVIGEIDFLVSLMARDASAHIVYDLYKGDDTVMADRIQIQQLLVNLSKNAIESVTKYPTRQVRISTRSNSTEGIITVIEDSGPGIDPHVAERLFHPLASTKPEGMGLGLSISSAIVENHKGRIWVEPSRLGGAAFCFVLPRAGNHGDPDSRTDGVRRR